jgi:hypothetical protein
MPGINRGFNLDPLIVQVQRWWTDQHAACGSGVSDPLGRPFEGLSVLYNFEEWRENAVVCPLTCGWRSEQTFDQLVASLRSEIKVNAVRTAGLLNRPDARVATQVASALMPAPWGEELTLVSDLIDAAGAKTVSERKRALKGAGIAVAVIVGFCFFSPGDRQAA